MQRVQQNARNPTTHIRKLPRIQDHNRKHTIQYMYFNDKENAIDEVKEILQKVITQIHNMTQEETNQEST